MLNISSFFKEIHAEYFDNWFRSVQLLSLHLSSSQVGWQRRSGRQRWLMSCYLINLLRTTGKLILLFCHGVILKDSPTLFLLSVQVFVYQIINCIWPLVSMNSCVVIHHQNHIQKNRLQMITFASYVCTGLHGHASGIFHACCFVFKWKWMFIQMRQNLSSYYKMASTNRFVVICKLIFPFIWLSFVNTGQGFQTGTCIM